MDIVICMTQEDFQDKIERKFIHDDEKNPATVYWSINQSPTNFKPEGKIYIATELFGKFSVVGYVTCEEINPDDIMGEILAWNNKTLKAILPIPCKPFQDFRYRWW